MAAQQVGRQCLGCFSPIDHMRKDAMRCRPCSARHEADRRKSPAFRAKHIEYMARQSAKRKRSAHHQNPGTGLASDPPHRVVRRCDYCAGMPEARVHDRPINDSIGSPMVANENGICNGCGLGYEPAPPIPRWPSIRSSGGTTARAGELYGAKTNQPGDKDMRQAMAPGGPQNFGGMLGGKRRKKGKGT